MELSWCKWNEFTVEVLEKGEDYAYCRVLDGPNEGREQEFYAQHFDSQV